MYPAVTFGSPLLTSAEYSINLAHHETKIKEEPKISRKAGESWSEQVQRQQEAKTRFERMIGDALDSLPEELSARMDNIAVVVEDGEPDGPVLGLYHGIDQTRRDASYSGVLPDLITIYRRPLEARARSEQELADSVRITVWHEVGHHFGLSDDRLRELGWG
ncbi:MAG: hypothetical protein NVSMB57_07390 [Actinomycetota bacterium]